VALGDELNPGAAIALDSDALIYYVEENPRYLPIVEPVMEALRAGQISAHVSMIVLLEVLVKPFRDGQPEVSEQYRRALLRNQSITLHPVNEAIAERAAAIRAAHRIEVAVSIVAATALLTDSEFLLTNNADDFRRVGELNIRIIDRYL
jgi:predicted nucleic acid-binding protein